MADARVATVVALDLCIGDINTANTWPNRWQPFEGNNGRHERLSSNPCAKGSEFESPGGVRPRFLELIGPTFMAVSLLCGCATNVHKQIQINEGMDGAALSTSLPLQPVNLNYGPGENRYHSKGEFRTVRLPSPYSVAQASMSQPSPAPRITLHLDEADVRKALDMVSRQAPMNILVAPGVTGSVTANLENVRIDEALEAILKLCNLVSHREKGMIYIYTAAEVPKLDLELLTFRLDYVAASDLLSAVTGLLSPAGDAFATQSSSLDIRRNQEMIVVTDTPGYLRRIEQYILQADQPPRQVMIEAYIFEVELEDEFIHGVNWDVLITAAGNSATLAATGFANPLAEQAFFVDIDGKNFNALIERLETSTDAKTLASPKVLVIDGQTARIQIGQQLGYRQTTVTETASLESVSFLDVGVLLEVTPHISRDNRVLLQVKPKVSTGEVNPITQLPEEETTEVQTDVLLENGQGFVIGGLIQEKDIITESKLPILGDLRWVGRLFQRHVATKSRTEIIVALLPRVMPFDPEYQAEATFDSIRTQVPLFRGPLKRVPRPWEPSLHDADDHAGEVPFLNGMRCRRCATNRCDCQAPSIQGSVFEPIERPAALTDEPANEAPLVPAEPSVAYAGHGSIAHARYILPIVPADPAVRYAVPPRATP